MKRSSKIKRLLSLTLAMACLFAVVAIPQVSAETADNLLSTSPLPTAGMSSVRWLPARRHPVRPCFPTMGLIFIMTINLRAAPCPLPFPRNPWRSWKKSASWISSCRSSIRTTTFGKTIFSSTTILPPTPTASPSLKRTSVFSFMPIIVCVLPSMRKRTSSANSASIRSATLWRSNNSSLRRAAVLLGERPGLLLVCPPFSGCLHR